MGDIHRRFWKGRNFSLPKCENEITECGLSDLTVFDITCNSVSDYALSIDLEVDSDVNAPLSFYMDDELIHTSSAISLPLDLTGLTATNSSELENITICIDEALVNCCIDYTIETPSCLFSSVDAHMLENVVLSPNPTRGMININQIPEEIISLKIVDNLGRSIEQINANRDIQLDVSHYTKGVYTVLFTSKDNQVISKRFVKM